jgi:hypothetical protein
MGKLFAYGNRKLPKHTAIFNMAPAMLCPADALGMCQLADSKKCYAMKPERQYKATLPYRKRQMEFWLSCTAREFVEKFTEDACRKRLKNLRFNEAGDFHHQSCVDKAEEIAQLLWNEKGIRTYGYTARMDLDYSGCKILVLNGSNEMIGNRFKIVYSQGDLDLHKKEGGAICIQDCRKCSMCSKKLGLEIAVLVH